MIKSPKQKNLAEPCPQHNVFREPKHTTHKCNEIDVKYLILCTNIVSVFMKHKIFRNDTITPQKTQEPVDDRIPNLENLKRFFFINLEYIKQNSQHS